MDKYTYILDIQALDLVILKHMDLIKEEDKRLIFLESQKDKKALVLVESKERLNRSSTLITSKEAELHTNQIAIDRNKVNIMSASSKNQLDILEKEKLALETKKNGLEDLIFKAMEDIESLTLEIGECEEFIGGVFETITEATFEREKVFSFNQGRIDQLESQINGLILELDESLKNTFLACRSKYRFNAPLVYLNDLSCSKCRFQNARQEVENIKKAKSHLICSSCGRILIAHN